MTREEQEKVIKVRVCLNVSIILAEMFSELE